MKSGLLFIDFGKNECVKYLTGLYFFIALVEFISQNNNDHIFLYITKPLLMPILMAIYCLKSKQKNNFFIASLLAAWIANLFFIWDSAIFIALGSVFFLVYRIAIFGILKFPGIVRVLIGCIPFLLAFLLFVCYNGIGLEQSLCIFMRQGILMVLFGGFVMGNYIKKQSESNFIMLLSTMFVTTAQFFFILKKFYIQTDNIQTKGFLLFVCGQYLLYRYVILVERRQERIRRFRLNYKFNS